MEKRLFCDRKEDSSYIFNRMSVSVFSCTWLASLIYVILFGPCGHFNLQPPPEHPGFLSAVLFFFFSSPVFPFVLP